MERTFRLLMEARYIISLHKNIHDLVPIIHQSENIINEDIYNYLKDFDLELYKRVINILQIC